MKRVFAIWMIGIYGVIAFQPALLVASFYFNRSYITTHLCIHRDMPWMHCDGKCFLDKELTNYYTTTTGNSANFPSKENIQIVSFWLNPDLISSYRNGSLFTGLEYPLEADSYQFKAVSSVFHPPVYTCQV